jgi:iron complex outermembrane recepter protein
MAINMSKASLLTRIGSIRNLIRNRFYGNINGHSIELKATALLLLLTILVLYSNNSIAQDPSTPAVNVYDLSLEQLGKIVVTASKNPRSVSNITQKIDVVTEKQIEQIVQGKRNIAELIQYVPGASVKVLSRNDVNWGAYGGIGPKYSTYMLQGLPIDGFADPMNIESMAIQRIEIQRGPASVLYPNYLSQDFAGNQSPLAGTINLILKEKIDAPQSKFFINYGSYNTITGQAYHERRFRNLHFYAGCSFEKSDYTNYGTTNSWLNMLKDPEYQKGKVFLGASLFLDKNEKHKISLFGNYTFHQGDVGRINRGYDNQYRLINIGYSGELAKSLKIAFKSGFRTYDRSWQEDNYSMNYDQSLRETDCVKQTIIPLDLSLTYTHFNNSMLTVGADYQHSYYLTTSQLINETEIIGNDASASQTGIYCQEELQLGKITLRGGGRYNFINYNIERLSGLTPGLKNRSWNVFLWSAGAKYRLAEEWALFVNAGSSFMSPGLKSIGGTLSVNDKFVAGKNGQLPNPDLKPENGIGFDLGIEGRILSSVYFSVRAFDSRITNAIIDNVISKDPSQTVSVNTEGKTEAQGFEISIKQYIEKKFDWFANLTLSKSKITDPENPDQNGAEIPFVPGVMGNLGVTIYLPYSIQISPMAHFGGQIYDSSSLSSRTAFASKELINLMASKTFKLKNDYSLNLFVNLYNITNNKFEMPWQFRDPGFNYSIGLRFSF